MFSFLLVSSLPHSLSAQAMPTATAPGEYIAVGGGDSIFQADYGQRDLVGFVAYADVHPTLRYGIEAEARFLHYHTSEDVTEANYLIGPRVSFRPGSHLRPYAKFLVGAGKIVLPYHYAQGSFLAFAPGCGVDYQLTDRITLRAIDFEYQIWPDFPYGSLHPYGISTGFSFRLNSVPRYPKLYPGRMSGN
ncbi:MAG: hypothetical protein P4K80_04235 [Acidobacteriaceae bacterium]|nr:hypothetical protein [Acidobacteriaceae bacterium]